MSGTPKRTQIPCKVGAREAAPLSTTSLRHTPRLSRACLSTPSMSSAVSPRQKALWVIRREASSISDTRRSEEHTSELQSLMRISYAVFCLKKKKTQNNYAKSPIEQRKQAPQYTCINEI